MRKPPEAPSGSNVGAGREAEPFFKRDCSRRWLPHKPASAGHPEQIADPIERLPVREASASAGVRQRKKERPQGSRKPGVSVLYWAGVGLAGAPPRL
jgi:hypothetical protein